MAADFILKQDSPYAAARRWPRYKLNVPLRIIAEGGDKTFIVQGRGTELNGGGMTVFVGMELKVGATVAVEFTPPYHGEPIRVSCIVRDRNGYVYGVEFLTENPEEDERVTQIRLALKAMGQPMR